MMKKFQTSLPQKAYLTLESTFRSKTNALFSSNMVSNFNLAVRVYLDEGNTHGTDRFLYVLDTASQLISAPLGDEVFFAVRVPDTHKERILLSRLSKVLKNYEIENIAGEFHVVKTVDANDDEEKYTVFIGQICHTQIKSLLFVCYLSFYNSVNSPVLEGRLFMFSTRSNFFVNLYDDRGFDYLSWKSSPPNIL